MTVLAAHGGKASLPHQAVSGPTSWPLTAAPNLIAYRIGEYRSGTDPEIGRRLAKATLSGFLKTVKD